MKRTPRLLWLWFLLFGVAVCFAQIGADSLNRFREWRIAKEEVNNTREYWMRINTTTGEGRWADLPNTYADFVATNFINTAIINVSTGGFFHNIWITNRARFVAGEKVYDFTGGGGDGNHLLISNAAGVALGWIDNETHFIGPVTATGVIVTNNIGAPVGTVAGVGGALTNFTFLAQHDERIQWINGGTTNVNIVAIMGGAAGLRWAGTIVMTNRTATPRLLSLSAVTNNWISLQALNAGISAPATITNSLALRLDWEIVGTSNVFYSIVHHALPAP